MEKRLANIGVSVMFEIDDFIMKCGMYIEDGYYINTNNIHKHEETIEDAIFDYVENELGFKITKEQIDHIKDEILMNREYFCITDWLNEKMFFFRIYDEDEEKYSTFLIQKYRGIKKEEE